MRKKWTLTEILKSPSVYAFLEIQAGGESFIDEIISANYSEEAVNGYGVIIKSLSLTLTTKDKDISTFFKIGSDVSLYISAKAKRSDPFTKALYDVLKVSSVKITDKLSGTYKIELDNNIKTIQDITSFSKIKGTTTTSGIISTLFTDNSLKITDESTTKYEIKSFKPIDKNLYDLSNSLLEIDGGFLDSSDLGFIKKDVSDTGLNYYMSDLVFNLDVTEVQKKNGVQFLVNSILLADTDEVFFETSFPPNLSEDVTVDISGYKCTKIETNMDYYTPLYTIDSNKLYLYINKILEHYEDIKIKIYGRKYITGKTQKKDAEIIYRDNPFIFKRTDYPLSCLFNGDKVMAKMRLDGWSVGDIITIEGNRVLITKIQFNYGGFNSTVQGVIVNE